MKKLDSRTHPVREAATPQRSRKGLSLRPAGATASWLEALGSGVRLPSSLRRPMESAFGTSLQAIRVHQGESVSHAAAARRS